MVAQLDSAVVRLRDLRGGIVGAGFLVGDGHVLTCAHVVARALDLPEDAPPPLNAQVQLDFPLIARGRILTARISVWHPPGLDRNGDVAGLELTSDAPAEARATRLLVADELWRHEFRTFGFPAGYDDGVWASGRLLARQAMHWVQMEDVKETGYRVELGFSGAPVWDDNLSGVVGMTVAAERRPELRAAYLIPAGVLVEAWPVLATQAIPPCPYRGLLAFREQDAALFLGREENTERLYNEVADNPLVAVIGPSGSGKSSLVFAGLLPRVRQRRQWAIVGLRPARGLPPIETLAAALLPLLEPGMSEAARLLELPALAAVLRDERLSEVVDRVLDKADARRLLLVLDQFEELFAWEAEDRERFIDAFLGAVAAQQQRAEPALTVVLTLRADFLGQALTHARLAGALQDAGLMLGPMTRDQLRRAIEDPAAGQVIYEPGLVNRILDEVGEHPGNLPLLEFTLTLLWERQANGKLTHAAYAELGGVGGALAQYAEEAYLRLPEAERDEARRIFVQLVRPGEGTEHTRRVARRPDMEERRWRLVERLASTRLVVTGQDVAGTATVEVVHEALIAGWDRLGRWVEADRAFREWQERTRGAVTHWGLSGHDDGVLLRGAPLAEAERWLEERPDEIGPAERAFLEASRRLQEEESTRTSRRNRRLRALAGGLSVLLVIAVLTATWAIVQTRLAQTRERTAQAHARVAESRELAQQALTNLDKRPSLALLQSIRAFRLADTTQARNSLLTALEREPRVDAFLPAPGPINNVAVAAGGRNIIINAWNTIDRWDANAHQHLGRTRVPGAPPIGDDVSTTFLGPRGGILAWAGRDAMRLWDVPGARELGSLPGDINASVAFSQDEKLAAVFGATWVSIWDLRSRKRLNSLSIAGSGYTIGAVSLQPKAGILAGFSESGSIRLWNLATHKRLHTFSAKTFSEEHPTVELMQFSPDGKLLAVADLGRMTVLNVVRKKTVATLGSKDFESKNSGTKDSGGISTSPLTAPAAFSPDGKTLAMRGLRPRDSDIILLDTTRGRVKATLASHNREVSSLAYSPDGHHLVSGSVGDETAVLWDLNRPPSLGRPLARIAGGVSATAMHGPDRASLWSLQSNGVVTATAVEAGAARPRSTRIDPELIQGEQFDRNHLGSAPVGTTLAFSPDFRTFATVQGIDANTKLDLWDVENGRPVGTLPLSPLACNSIGKLAFSPDGAHIAAGSADGSGTVTFWDARTRQHVATLPSGEKGQLGIEAMAFSLHSSKLATLQGDTVTLWDVQNPRRLMSIVTGPGPSGWEGVGPTAGRVAMALSPDGGTLAINGDGNVVALWDLVRGQQLGVPLVGHSGFILGLAFSPDGRTLASADVEGDSILWDLSTRQPLGKPLAGDDGSITSLAFSADGKTLASSTYNAWYERATTLAWDIDPMSWARQACRTVAPVLRLGTGASLSGLGPEPLCG